MKFLFVYAHPDDESFFSGGTIAKLTSQKHVVKLICATKGEAGMTGDFATKENLGSVREEELRNVAKVLGISQLFFLEFIDSTLLENQNELEQKILEIYKSETPDVVVTFDKYGASNHPDHIAISNAATAGFKTYLDFTQKYIRLYHTAVPRSLVEKYRGTEFGYKAFGEMKGTLDSEITTVIDIKDFINKKLAAFMCHKTQKHDISIFSKSPIFSQQKEFFELILENNLV